MKNPFKTFLNWLFPYRNFPETLAEELSVISPYSIFETQPMIDKIVVYFGYKPGQKEAEKTWGVKIKAYKIIELAMQQAISLEMATILILGYEIIFDKNGKLIEINPQSINPSE